jgi:hypothetical protein
VRAAKTQPTATELELATIAHALGDPARRHDTPFGVEWQGQGYLCATDGHRLSAVRSASWRDYVRETAPRVSHLIDLAAGLPWVGSLSALALDGEARCFPKSWDVGLRFRGCGSGTRASLTALVTRGSGKNERKLYPLGRELLIDWGEGSYLEQLSIPLGITLRYLLDAVDHCDSGTVYVHNAEELGPILFLPYPARRVEDAERFEIVMPRRL